MLKLALSSLILFSIFRMEATAQTTVKFEDKSTKTIDGKLIGTLLTYDAVNKKQVEENVKTWYKVDGDTIEISVYSESIAKQMEDFYIYRIHRNQLTLDVLYTTEQPDASGKMQYYVLFLVPVEGVELKYTSYDFTSSAGETAFNDYFAIRSNKKEGLEELIQLLGN